MDAAAALETAAKVAVAEASASMSSEAASMAMSMDAAAAVAAAEEEEAAERSAADAAAAAEEAENDKAVDAGVSGSIISSARGTASGADSGASASSAAALAHDYSKWPTYEEGQKIAVTLKLASAAQWKKWVKDTEGTEASKRQGLPPNPQEIYKGRGWKRLVRETFILEAIGLGWVGEAPTHFWI